MGTNLITRDKLVNDLQKLNKKFDCMDCELLKNVFKEDYKFFEDTIMNIKKTGRSDIVISFGNNSCVSKVFINDIISKKEFTNCQIINLNSFIHTTEDGILKKFCKKLDIDTEKPGFDGARKAIEDYYKGIIQSQSKKKKRDENFLVIFFDNIDQLFIKKKQILVYTLLEIVNISSNLLFCGTASSSNLIDLMEKRNRSRFSQKTSFIRIKDSKSLIEPLCNYFLSITENDKNFDENCISSFQIFIETLFTFDTTPDHKFYNKIEGNFFLLIENLINLGKSIKEILTKIKYIMSMLAMNIDDYKDDGVIIAREKLLNIIKCVIMEYEMEESNGNYLNSLKNFPKLHITLLICLWRCTVKYKTKITIGMIYKEYEDFVQPKFQQTSFLKPKLDLIIVKKALEELNNSNLITITHDERFIQLYELKQPCDITQKLIFKLDDWKNGNFDTEMYNFLNFNIK